MAAISSPEEGIVRFSMGGTSAFTGLLSAHRGTALRRFKAGLIMIFGQLPSPLAICPRYSVPLALHLLRIVQLKLAVDDAPRLRVGR